MSAELKDQVQAYTEYFIETIDPVEVGEVVAGPELSLSASPVRAGWPVPRWAVGWAAALAVLLILGGTATAIWLFAGPGDQKVVDQPTTTVTTIPALDTQHLFEDLALTGVFDAAGVDSYRGRLSWNTGRVEGEFTRDASRVWGYGPGEEVITIGSESWNRFGLGEWEGGDPYGFGEPIPALSYAWATPVHTSLGSQQVLGDVNDYVIVVGKDTVNGRSTVHYRVDKAGFEQAAAASGHRIDLTEGRLDVWIDEAGQFPVKWELVTAGKGFRAACWGDCYLKYADPDDPFSGRLEWSLELYDFGADITIEPPD